MNNKTNIKLIKDLLKSGETIDSITQTISAAQAELQSEQEQSKKVDIARTNLVGATLEYLIALNILQDSALENKNIIDAATTALRQQETAINNKSFTISTTNPIATQLVFKNLANLFSSPFFSLH